MVGFQDDGGVDGRWDPVHDGNRVDVYLFYLGIVGSQVTQIKEQIGHEISVKWAHSPKTIQHGLAMNTAY